MIECLVIDQSGSLLAILCIFRQMLILRTPVNDANCPPILRHVGTGQQCQVEPLYRIS